MFYHEAIVAMMTMSYERLFNGTKVRCLNTLLSEGRATSLISGRSFELKAS